MKIRKSCAFIYLITTVLINLFSLESHVLVVHSYHSGYLWTDNVSQGIESVLRDRPNTSLHIEYLDSKRQFDENYKQLIYNLLAYKIKKHDYDLIITTDNNAFDLVYSFKDNLFPSTPILFCGINNVDESQISEYKGVSGVNESADIIGNIELIYKLQPNVDKIVVIADDTVTGRALQQEITDIREFNSGWKLEVIHDISMEDLLSKLQTLGSDTAVLLTVFFRDKIGDFYEYDVGTPLITANTKSPVYALWDFNLNQGVVGGLVVDATKHGIMVAEQAVQILEGTDITDIPIEYNTPTSLVMDYNVISDFKLQTNNLKNITYINKPERIWDQYRVHIIFTLVIFTLLILAVYGLTYSLIISKKSKREYLSLVNNIPGVTYRCLFDEFYSMLIIGNGIIDITGYSSDEFLNGTINLTSLIIGDDREPIRKTINEAIYNKDAYTLEYQIQDRDGNKHWIQERGRGIFTDLGNLLFLDGIILDITHQKETEKDLEHYRKHLEELVDERTRYLSDAQEHIIETSKMSSLALLVSGVAHEINTPAGICLTSISYLLDEVKTQINSMEREETENSEILKTLKKYLKTINLSLNNINRINSVIENFKQMSVDQNNEAPRLFNVTPYFRNLFIELYGGDTYKDLSIELEAADELIIYSHPGVLTQIFNYLIENTMDHAYTEQSPTDKVITITITEEDEKIHIIYKDNGVGIPQEDSVNIFEPFYTTLRHKGHHGLGLNIVYNLLLKKLNGEITYDSDNAAFLISFKPDNFNS